MIPFTQFLGFTPDLDHSTPGAITECENLIPTLRGYAGGPTGADVGMDALAAAPLAAATMVALNGDIRLYVGTGTKLYQKGAFPAWTDVSRIADYNAVTSKHWRFAQFGDTSLAVNKYDVLQSSSGGDFADEVAPKASLMCVASGFVMLADTNEAIYSDSPNRWWCSALYDVTNWTPAISTQCATGLLVDTPGGIKGLKTLGQHVVVYKNKSMYLGRYSGPPGVWQFTLVAGDIGCLSNESIANIDVAHIFIGESDIYSFDGSRPVPIGSPLRKWFFDDLDPAQAHLTTHIVDKTNALVYFHYPRKGSAGVLTGCIVYNWKTNTWGLAHKTISTVVEYVTGGGLSWDEMPIPTWDTYPSASYDSAFWVAQSRLPAFIAPDKKIYALTGDSVSSSLTTSDSGIDNQFSLLRRVTVRYLKIPTTAKLTNYYQNTHGNSWTTGVTTDEYNGRFDVLQSAPWHRAKVDFTGVVEVTGFSADVEQGGIL